jgi:hypothetical protein
MRSIASHLDGVTVVNGQIGIMVFPGELNQTPEMHIPGLFDTCIKMLCFSILCAYCSY